MDLKGKVAVVTGGAQGIGKAIAGRLVDAGCSIAVVDVNLELAETTAKEFSAKGVQAIAVKTDVSDFSSVEEGTKKIFEKFGKIDILVNNAGVTRDTLILRMKPEDWDFVLDINLKGTFNFTKAVLPYMLKQKSGRIVNIASIIGLIGNVGQANYAASKAGIIGLTKATAKESASRGITVNAVAPGFIETAMTQKVPENIRAEMLKLIPMKVYGKPEDVADGVLFLVSDLAKYITGQVLVIDGGMAM